MSSASSTTFSTIINSSLALFPPADNPFSKSKENSIQQEKEEEEEEEKEECPPQQKNNVQNGCSSPAITVHENLFETIAKLVDLNESAAAADDEEVEEEGEEEESVEEGKAENDQCGVQQNGEEVEEANNKKDWPKLEAENHLQSRGNPLLSSASSSSSRRKNGNPTRIKDALEKGKIEEGQKGIKSLENEEPKEEEADGQTAATSQQQIGPFQFQNGQIAAGGGDEEQPQYQQQQQQQRHFYSQLVQQCQQQQQPGAAAAMHMPMQQPSQMADMQRSFTRLAQTLKEELSGLFAGPIDKDHQMLGDFGPTEEAANAHSGRLMAALSMAARQHHWAAEQLAMFNQGAAVAQQQRAMQAAAAAAAATTTAPFPGGRILPRGHPPAAAAPGLPNPFQAFFAQNPLMAAMAAASAAHQQQQQQQQQYSAIASAAAGIPSAATASNGARGGGGAASIFPANTANGGFVPPHPQRPFGPLPTAQQHHAQHQQPHFSRHRYTEADGSPRKKRAKVTDSVRGPRSSLHPCREPGGSYLSQRLAAQAEFAPTMVPLSSQQVLFRPSAAAEGTRGGSPSGDDSEEGGDMLYRTQLTHVHLRKAKLMFFYQRYPSSAMLKSYFPDVQFNKHNTAQLVKWFSNFREFYYMQMEKYAKQALAEGVKHREELVVTQDAEIFKQLNVHYNKNSVFQPPERLQFVIQETLREFFTALQLGKDAEPSWKKTIYKVIQQLDEPIPEFFKHPEFVDMLERTLS